MLEMEGSRMRRNVVFMTTPHKSRSFHVYSHWSPTLDGSLKWQDL